MSLEPNHLPSPSPTVKQGTSWLSLLNTFLIVMALGFCAYLFYTFKGMHVHEKTILATIKALNAHQQDDAAQSTRDLETLTQKIKQQAHALNETQHQLSSLAPNSVKDTHFVLMKARYLLELAQTNAHWTEDTASTVALLQDADALLATLNDPALSAIRQALARDIIEQQQASHLDTIKLLAQLNADQTLVDQLPLSTAPVKPSIKTNNDPVNKVWNDLKHLVIVHHDEASLTQPLTQEVLIREQLRLSLETAGWAVVHRDQALFELSLTQALQTLQRHVDPSARMLLEHQLLAWKHLSLVQKHALQTDALQQLEEYLNTLHPQTPTTGASS